MLSLDKREVKYLAYFFSNLEYSDYEDLPPDRQVEIHQNYSKMILCIAAFLPENPTEEALRDDSSFMESAAFAYVFNEARQSMDLIGLSNEEINDGIDQEDIVEIAEMFYRLAVVLIDVLPKMLIAKDLIDWEDGDLDAALVDLLSSED